MRTRTLLTTPPGHHPVPIVSDGWDPRVGPHQEHYAPGFARPSEPLPPSRLTRPILVSGSLVLVVALGVMGIRLLAPGLQDPSLPEDGAAPASPAGQPSPASS